MPKPRTPTAILELRGAFKKDPQRRRNNEPAGAGDIGEPPHTLTQEECDAWAEVSDITPVGVLTGSDRIHMEIVSQLLAWQREVGIRDFPAQAARRLDTALGKLGMNPSDRTRLEVPAKAQSDSPFADLAAPPRRGVEH